MWSLEFEKYLMYSFVLLCIIMLFPKTKGDVCNEAVCGSIVSKCILIEKCLCKLSDCYRCNDCINCLGNLYTDCCSCLNMCNKPNDSLKSLRPKLQIGDFKGDPEIFKNITSYKNTEKWKAISFRKRKSAHSQIHDAVNCTVVYWNTCQTNEKCTKACEDMGAKSYRWFQDGCCECVGANCYNNSINKSRCSACPEDKKVRRN